MTYEEAMTTKDEMPETIYAWRHGDDEPINGMWLECDDSANPAAATYVRADTPAPVEISGLSEDAAKWRALVSSARITCMGSAGFHKQEKAWDDKPYRHVTLNLWTHGDTGDKQDKAGREMLEKYVSAISPSVAALPKPDALPEAWDADVFKNAAG